MALAPPLIPVYKATVRQNGALTDDGFLDLNPEGKMGVWKFCKNSDKAKAVHALEELLFQDVKAAKAAAQETRKKLKLTQAKRLMDMMAKAIEYGGPLSVDNIDGILFKLNLEETLNEVKLARATLDATIRQKYLVKNADGKGTFVNEPLSQLKSSLRDAIKPSDSPKLSIEELLARAYQSEKLFNAKDGEDGADVQFMQRLSRAYLESCFGASCCRNMPLKPPRPAAGRGGGRGQRQPKPGCGHATAVLSALATEATRPRFKSPQRAKRSLKSAQKHRRALAWPRARRLHPGTPKWAVLAASAPSTFCRAF